MFTLIRFRKPPFLFDRKRKENYITLIVWSHYRFSYRFTSFTPDHENGWENTKRLGFGRILWKLWSTYDRRRRFCILPKINVYKLKSNNYWISSKLAIKVEIRLNNKTYINTNLSAIQDCLFWLYNARIRWALRKRFRKPPFLPVYTKTQHIFHLGKCYRKPSFSLINTSVFDRISVDVRRICIKKYAFSNKTHW